MWHNFEEADKESLKYIKEKQYTTNEDLFGTIKAKTIVETEEFVKTWEELGLNDDDLRELQQDLIELRDTATPLGSDLYKIRFAPSRYNKGKSGSFRVIFIDLYIGEKIYLVYAFSKSEFDNISKAELDVYRELAKNIPKDGK